MVTFPSITFHKLCLKNTHSLPRNERTHYFFRKNPQKLQIVQHFFGFQLARAAPVLLLRATGVSSTSHVINKLGQLGTGVPLAPVCRAGGKPSTWFPPGTRRADRFVYNKFSKFPSSEAPQI